MKRKKLLLFAYFYPPLGGPAVHRPLKLVKFLKDTGWDTDVISVRDIVYHSWDESLLKEDRSNAVYRTRSADVMSLLKKAGEKGKLDSDKVYFKTPEFLKKIVRNSFLIDDKYGWMKYALKRAKELCKVNEYQAIMATIGPYTAAVAAYKLQKHTGIPLIIDYRDHWTLNPFLGFLTPFHKVFARYWENRILSNTTLVVTAGRRMLEELEAEFDPDLSSRGCVMYNGWDDADFPGLETETSEHVEFVISYIGGLYGKRTVSYFLQALEELLSAGKLPDRLKIRFVGNYYQETLDQLSQSKFEKIIEIMPQVEHWQALKLMLNSDLLLLISPQEELKSSVTGKIFEYIRSGKRIFGMVPPDCEAADLLREHGHKQICAMEDVEKIKQDLIEIFNEKADSLEIELLQKYSRAEQVKGLAEKLEKLT